MLSTLAQLEGAPPTASRLHRGALNLALVVIAIFHESRAAASEPAGPPACAVVRHRLAQLRDEVDGDQVDAVLAAWYEARVATVQLGSRDLRCVRRLPGSLPASWTVAVRAYAWSASLRDDRGSFAIGTPVVARLGELPLGACSRAAVGVSLALGARLGMRADWSRVALLTPESTCHADLLAAFPTGSAISADFGLAAPEPELLAQFGMPPEQWSEATFSELPAVRASGASVMLRVTGDPDAGFAWAARHFDASSGPDPVATGTLMLNDERVLVAIPPVRRVQPLWSRPASWVGIGGVVAGLGLGVAGYALLGGCHDQYGEPVTCPLRDGRANVYDVWAGMIYGGFGLAGLSASAFFLEVAYATP